MRFYSRWRTNCAVMCCRLPHLFTAAWKKIEEKLVAYRWHLINRNSASLTRLVIKMPFLFPSSFASAYFHFSTFFYEQLSTSNFFTSGWHRRPRWLVKEKKKNSRICKLISAESEPETREGERRWEREEGERRELYLETDGQRRKRYPTKERSYKDIRVTYE